MRLVFKKTSYTGGEEMGKVSSQWWPSFWGNLLLFSLTLRYFRVQFSTNALPLLGAKDDLIYLIISPYIGKMVRPSIYNLPLLAYLDTQKNHCLSLMSFRDAYIGIGFPGNLEGQESACSVGETGDKGLILGSKRSPGEGHENPLQYPCLENPVYRGAWQVTVHSVAKSRTWL